jgi:hypothetical protein
MSTSDDATGGPKVPGEPVQVPPPPRYTISAAKYEAAWLLYRDGARTVKMLQAVAHMSHRVAKAAIHTGFPHLGYPSLTSRAELWDKAKNAERAKVGAQREHEELKAQVVAEIENWKAFKQSAMRLVGGTAYVLDRILSLLKEVVGLMDARAFTRTRLVKRLNEKTGLVVEVHERYVDAQLVMQFMRAFVSMRAEEASAVSFVLGGPNARIDNTGTAAPTRELTEEEVQGIIATGDLPAGVDDIMLATALARIDFGKEGTG